MYQQLSLFLHGWSNLLVAFFLTYDSNIYIAELGLVTKKKELPKTFLYLFSYLFSLSSLFFSLMLFKMHLKFFECLAILKCATIFEEQFSISNLANFLLLADYPSVKLTNKKAIKKTKIIRKDCKNLTSTQYLPETTFDSFFTTQIDAQIVEFTRQYCPNR